VSLEVVQLKDLLDTGRSKEEIQQILLTFCSLPCSNPDEVHDVQFFLHNKAIEFEKMDISRTFLVFSTYKNTPYLAGYYSLSNKPLVISKKNFSKMSNSLKKSLMGIGHKTDAANYEVKGFLLGQLGKNFSPQALAANMASGADLIALAHESMYQAYRTVGGRIFYLECEDVQPLKDFYIKLGFREIQNYRSDSGYCIFVQRIENVSKASAAI